jgi:hypothetical protein
MGQMIARAAVVALLILAAPLQASAECAWVLWQRTLLPIQVTAPIETFKTREECRAEAERAHNNWTKNPGPYVNNYLCLPDTIDPRGPKGR